MNRFTRGIIMIALLAGGLTTQAPAGLNRPGDRQLDRPKSNASPPRTPVPLPEGWAENFDSYPSGSGLIGLSGWDGWDGNHESDALISDAQSRSAPHSVAVLPTSDVVYAFAAVDTGVWVMTAWSYVPSGSTGAQYFILLNTYPAEEPNDWSTQVEFNADTGLVRDFDGEGALPLITDRWVELKVLVDLVGDTQAVYYDDQILWNSSWTGHIAEGGVPRIAGLDLYSAGGSFIYWDDLTLTASDCYVYIEKFEDTDCDGIKDPGERGLPGWQFTITGPITRSTMSSLSGDARFTGLPAGTYTLCETPQAGWIVAAPPGGCTTVQVTEDGEILIPFANCPTPASDCTAAPECLVGWWPFDENSGTTAADAAGCVNGTLVGGPSRQTNWGVGSSLNLQATQYVNIPPSGFMNAWGLNLANFSIDAWFRSDCPESPDPRYIMSMGTTAGFELFLLGGSLAFTAWDGVTNPLPVITAGSGLAANTWNFVAVTVSSSNGLITVTLYINGTPHVFSYPGSLSSAPLASTLRFGESTLGTSNGLCAFLDEPEIFNCCLTTAELDAIYAADEDGKCGDQLDLRSTSTLCFGRGTIPITVSASEPGDTYRWGIAQLPGCSAPPGASFTPAGGTFVMPPSTCLIASHTIPVTAVTTGGLFQRNNLCYQVTVTNLRTGETFTQQAAAVERTWLCILTNAGPPTAIHPNWIVVGGSIITNDGDVTQQFSYMLEPRPADGTLDNLTFGFEGLEPGQSITGVLEIPPGETRTIDYSVVMNAYQPFRVYEVVLKEEVELGVYEPVASFGYVSVAEDSTLTGVDDQRPDQFSPQLRIAASPNPFFESATLHLSLPVAAPVSINIYDAGGRLIRSLTSEHLSAGVHAIAWDGKDDQGRRLGSGVYFAKVVTPQARSTKKLILLR